VETFYHIKVLELILRIKAPQLFYRVQRLSNPKLRCLYWSFISLLQLMFKILLYSTILCSHFFSFKFRFSHRQHIMTAKIHSSFIRILPLNTMFSPLIVSFIPSKQVFTVFE